jgi:Raf kinase inhibitor-like YbhB/YbcL family protein
MTSKLSLCAAVALLASVAVLNGASAQERVRTMGPLTPRVIALAPAKDGAKIVVTSPDFEAGGWLHVRHMQATTPGGEDKAPALAWTAGPPGTQSYAVFAEGEGENRRDPTTHWSVYNIPATTLSLPRGLPKDPYLKEPAGAINGLEHSVTGYEETYGASGYKGPNAPKGAVHPYYFQVLALDTKLDLKPEAAKRSAVAAAMKGHVLASGEIVVKYESQKK